MAFETFKRQRVPVTNDPAVTIQKRGTLSINIPAYLGLGSPEAVELLYDRERRLMGMRMVEPQAEHAYVVRPLGRSRSNWLISGRAFTNYYDIPTEVARRWLARFEDDTLIIDLNKPGTEVAPTGGKRPQEEVLT